LLLSQEKDDEVCGRKQTEMEKWRRKEMRIGNDGRYAIVNNKIMSNKTGRCNQSTHIKICKKKGSPISERIKAMKVEEMAYPRELKKDPIASFSTKISMPACSINTSAVIEGPTCMNRGSTL
jgi:hypothetical protein